MRAYVWTLVILMAIEIVGKAAMLKDGDHLKPRNPDLMCLDVIVGVVLVMWGAYLLGSS